MIFENKLLVWFVFLGRYMKVLSVQVTSNSNPSMLKNIVGLLYDMDLSNQTEIMSLFGIEKEYRAEIDNYNRLGSRYKRQAGGGKFVESSRMGQTKVLQLQIQMWKNLVSRQYVGGPHPLHRIIPFAFVEILKLKVFDYFSPDITVESKV
ncbi:uncharacterized protein LOC126369548 [Pectinophora gossypiella]|uniref:uncharacterized protein LOC126369548 n=1 Tax=Pectinophora gossypiella TaxID=13191 RepID=UPI00214F2CAE|nr:uncharacterized protein LOC126369548 [Pectinophora gossypiella]